MSDWLLSLRWYVMSDWLHSFTWYVISDWLLSLMAPPKPPLDHSDSRVIIINGPRQWWADLCLLMPGLIRTPYPLSHYLMYAGPLSAIEPRSSFLLFFCVCFLSCELVGELPVKGLSLDRTTINMAACSWRGRPAPVP